MGGRRRYSKDHHTARGLTVHFVIAFLGLVCCSFYVEAQERNATIDGGDDTFIATPDELTRRADENERMSFSGDADFEARRPRGLLAALFGYPDEFENNESPASDSGYGVQDESNIGRGGGTPPPRFKASHYNTSKKPTFTGKTTGKTTTTTATKISDGKVNVSSIENLQDRTNARNVTSIDGVADGRRAHITEMIELNNATINTDDGEEDIYTSSSTEGSSANKREVVTQRGRTGRNSVQGRPLPAGYILWHPVPASFLKGQNHGDEGSMALSSSETKQQMFVGQNGRFVPHRPFFVEPNMHGAPLTRLPFPMVEFSSPQVVDATPSEGPRENKAAAKLHRQMERERNRQNRDRKKKAKKQRQKASKEHRQEEEQEEEENEREHERGRDTEERPNDEIQPPNQPLHLMLPPLPMNGFPDSPFHEQRPFEQQEQQHQQQQQQQRPMESPQSSPIQLNRDFPPVPQPERQQMPPHDSAPFSGEQNIEGRPPDNTAFEHHNRPFENHNGNNRPFENNNNRPFENQNRPFENDNHRIFDNHNTPFENHNNNQRPEGFAGSFEVPRFRERPSPSPSAHPVKFEIDHHDRLQQHQREMVEHQFQRGPLPPLPPPPPPRFPPPHFPPPFNDQRPFPDLPPPPPPPPLGAASRDNNNKNNGHRFRDSSSPPPQQLDQTSVFDSSAQTFKQAEHLRPLDFRHQLPQLPPPPPPPQTATSQLPPFVDITSPSGFHSSSPDLSFGHSSTQSSPTQSPANFANFNSFSGPPPPLSAPPASHPGMNNNQREPFMHPDNSNNNNNGFIYSRDFKKAMAEANIVLPNQSFGPLKMNEHETARTISRSSSTTTTALPPPRSSFGLPSTIIPTRSPGEPTTPVPMPHRPPRPAIRTEDVTPTSQHNPDVQQPFSRDTPRPHPHQVSPAASHRLPQADPHPNLPDFRPNPTTIRADRADTINYELQREQNVQMGSSTSSFPPRARDNYKSPGFHTGHKGYPSSVTAPNQVSSSEEATLLHTMAPPRASPTIKSNFKTLQPSVDDTTVRSQSTSPAYGYVRHSQSSRSQPSASFSYEIKYQSPAPQVVVNNPSSTQHSRLSINTRANPTSSTTTYRPASSYKPRISQHRRMRNGNDRRSQQPDITSRQ